MVDEPTIAMCAGFFLAGGLTTAIPLAVCWYLSYRDARRELNRRKL